MLEKKNDLFFYDNKDNRDNLYFLYVRDHGQPDSHRFISYHRESHGFRDDYRRAMTVLWDDCMTGTMHKLQHRLYIHGRSHVETSALTEAYAEK